MSCQITNMSRKELKSLNSKLVKGIHSYSPLKEEEDKNGKLEEDAESSCTVSKVKSPMGKTNKINGLNNKIDHAIHKANKKKKQNICPSDKYGYDFPNILGLIRVKSSKSVQLNIVETECERKLSEVKPSKSEQLDLVETESERKLSEDIDTSKDYNDSFDSKLQANVVNKVKKSDLSQSLVGLEIFSDFNSECQELNDHNNLIPSHSLLNMSTSGSKQTKTSPLDVNVNINTNSESPKRNKIVKTLPIGSIKKSKRKELTPGIYLNDHILINSSKIGQLNMPIATNLVDKEQKVTEIESVESYDNNSSLLTLDNTNFNSYCSNSTITSKSMFDRNYLDFGDHELFCESCDDFHPQHKGPHLSTCKQNKNNVDSLLNCVLDKKDTTIVANPIVVNKQLKHKMDRPVGGKGVNDAEELKKTSLMLSKGKRYQVQFKTKVVNYALNHNTKQAAHMFKVNRGTVSEWLTERKRYIDNSSPKQFIDKDNFEPGDSEFLSWLESSKFNLTNDLIKQKTTEWLSTGKRINKNCQWLRMYAHRLHGVKDSLTKKRYITYPDTFKRLVVFYAETHSKIAAARVFNVARRRVLEWQELAGSKKRKAAGNQIASNLTDESVDKKVWEWYCNQKFCPSSKQVRDKALEMYRSAGYLSIACGAQWYYRWRARNKLPPPRAQQISDFQLLAWVLTQLDNNRCVTHSLLAEQAAIIFNTKVSRGWTFRFCKKFHKLLLTLPNPSTPLFPAMESQVCNYRKLVQDTLATCGTTNVSVVAMDEVPLQFLPKDSGKRPLLLRRPGFESCLASLVISSFSDGTLLPTMLIFKGNLPTATKVDPTVVTTVTETGKASEGTMIQWINQVLLKQLGETASVLITDCFDIHTTKEVQTLLRAHNIQHLVIPGGCAFKLLPVTQICQSFQTMLEEMCYSAIVQQTETLQPPSPDQLYNWSHHVHKHLTENQNENTKAAFKEMLLKPS